MGDYLVYAAAELTNIRLIYLLNLGALACLLSGTTYVCRRLTTRGGVESQLPAWLVMALLLSAHVLAYGTHVLMLENVAAAICLGGVLVLYSCQSLARQAVAAILFGVSAYLKLFIWPFIAAAYGVRAIVRTRPFPWLSAGLFLALLAPHLLWNARVQANPFYPLGTALFGCRDCDRYVVGRLEGLEDFSIGYGLDILLAPLITFFWPRQYGYPLGPVPLLFFVTIALVVTRARWREKFRLVLWPDEQFRQIFLLAILGWLFWIFTAQGRFFTPVLVVQSVSLVLMVAAVRPSGLSQRLLHAGIAFVLLCQFGEALLCAHLFSGNVRNLSWSWPKTPEEITFQFKDTRPQLFRSEVLPLLRKHSLPVVLFNTTGDLAFAPVERFAFAAPHVSASFPARVVMARLGWKEALGVATTCGDLEEATVGLDKRPIAEGEGFCVFRLLLRASGEKRERLKGTDRASGPSAPGPP